jgi:uncharacterized lipoprotein YehR (DUF1307 family)
MKKILRLSAICLVAVLAVSFNSCKDDDETEQPKMQNELLGRWNAVKAVVGDEIITNNLASVFIQFNEDGTCLVNINGSEDVDANYSYSEGILTLSSPLAAESGLMDKSDAKIVSFSSSGQK